DRRLPAARLPEPARERRYVGGVLVLNLIDNEHVAVLGDGRSRSRPTNPKRLVVLDRRGIRPCAIGGREARCERIAETHTEATLHTRVNFQRVRSEDPEV